MLETALGERLGRNSLALTLCRHITVICILPDGIDSISQIIRVMYKRMYAFMARRALLVLLATARTMPIIHIILPPFRDKVEVIYPPISIPEPNCHENAAKLRKKLAA